MVSFNNAQKTLVKVTLLSWLVCALMWIAATKFAMARGQSFIIGLVVITSLVSLLVLLMKFGRQFERRILHDDGILAQVKVLQQDALQTEREKRLIFDHLIEAVVVVDESMRVVAINHSARSLFGVHGNLYKKSLAELIREPEIHEVIAEARLENNVVERSVKIGLDNSVSLYVKAGEINEGEVIIAILDLNQLHAFDERHDDFIAHVSHELKTPISVIMANAELLLFYPEKNNSRLVQAIHRQAHRAKDLLESLLELLRLHAGHYEVRPEAIELALFINEIADSLGHVGGIIKNDVSAGTVVFTDRLLFERLAHIIIENAQKYAGDHPALTITAVSCDDRIKIQFVDNGPGIKSHLRERVFEQFFRQPHDETAEREGFGLGLSHARAIANALGGQIFVEDHQKSGCCFSVLLKKSCAAQFSSPVSSTALL